MPPATKPARSSRPHVFLACGLLLVCFVAGCVPGPEEPAGTFGLDFSLPPGAGTRGAVVFYVDGVNAGIFAEMLDAGELPAIRQHFADRGLYCRRAVANTPSVTLANETSFVTGRFPGHHGITGINWFDRTRLLWRNYETIAQKNTLDGDYTAPTIYEMLGRRTTVSIFFQAHRGATKFVENWTSAGPPFFFGWYEFVDRLTLSRFELVMDLARARRAFPAVTVAYLLAPDFRAYAEGVGSGAYRAALRHTDRQIGRVLADMDRAGLLDDLTLVLTSDHSLMDVTQHFPIEQFLREELGLKIGRARLWEKTPFEKRLTTYQEFPCVLYGSGDRYWAVQLRRPQWQEDGRLTYAPWPHRPSAEVLRNWPVAAAGPAGAFDRGDANEADDSGDAAQTIDLPARLVAQPAVDVVAWATGPNEVRVLLAGGEVAFAQPDGPGGDITCRVVCGDDPLGWRDAVPADVLSGRRGLSPEAWLEATADTEYPDLPPQIVAYFRARRAGDLAVFAAPGWDFNTVNSAGHGGLRPGDLHVPLLIAGPGVPHAKLDHARTVDVLPTLLTLLGEPVPPGLDGRPLVAPRAQGQ